MRVWRPVKLVSLLPTVVTVVGIDYYLHNGMTPPLPFIFLLGVVAVAGAFGGLMSGLIAGLLSAWQIFHSHFAGFGPDELTGRFSSATLGAVVFVTIGIVLGRLRDVNDMTVTRLREAELQLERAVELKTKERDDEAAKVFERDGQLRQANWLSGIGFFRWNVETGDCEFCSEQHAAHFGLSQQEYQAITSGPEPYTGFVHEEDRSSFLSAISRVDDGEALPFDYRILRPDGEVRHIRQINEPVFDDAGKGIAVVGSSIDFTELQKSQEHLRQAQKVEAIGNLTGGVAHDFNNLLAVILGNLELYQEIEDPETRSKLIGEAIKATNRGADLVKSLLSFARRAHLTPTRLNLNQVLNNTAFWSSRVLPETISIETSLFAGLWDTELDATSIEAAIINLLLNARDAMPNGGRLTLETANMRIGDEYIDERFEDIEPGRYVMLAISDTGFGIAEDILDQIFEPFYTDKPVGEGTGLGLSMVQGFIKQSNGAMRVYTEVGIGTTFKLYFKASEGAPLSAEIKDSILPAGDQDGLRILLAEDEKSVAVVLRNILELAGHSVIEAGSGDEALEIYKETHAVDILLTDIVMPGKLQGPALAKAIRAIDPEFPCVFLSGYAAEATVHGNGLKPSDTRLMKPASRTDLLAAIDEVWALRHGDASP